MAGGRRQAAQATAVGFLQAMERRGAGESDRLAAAGVAATVTGEVTGRGPRWREVCWAPWRWPRRADRVPRLAKGGGRWRLPAWNNDGGVDGWRRSRSAANRNGQREAGPGAVAVAGVFANMQYGGWRPSAEWIPCANGRKAKGGAGSAERTSCTPWPLSALRPARAHVRGRRPCPGPAPVLSVPWMQSTQTPTLLRTRANSAAKPPLSAAGVSRREWARGCVRGTFFSVLLHASCAMCRTWREAPLLRKLHPPPPLPELTTRSPWPGRCCCGAGPFPTALPALLGRVCSPCARRDGPTRRRQPPPGGRRRRSMSMLHPPSHCKTAC